jgi:hypothetical protein
MKKLVKHEDSYNDLQDINDNDFDIILSDFEEEEYDLSGIGLEGFYLSVEQYNNYLYSEDGFVFSFQEYEEFKKYLNSVNDYFILCDEDEMECRLTEEQLDTIKHILVKGE